MYKPNIIPKPNHIEIFNGLCNNLDNIIFVLDNDIDHQGYELTINYSDIVIKHSSEIGKMYAISTLKQLKMQEKLPCMRIVDKPQYDYRGLLIDVCRHFVPKDKILQTIELMGMYKLNKLHLHLTDDQGWRIEIKKYPLLTEKGNLRKASQIDLMGKMDNTPYGENMYFTQEDIREIVHAAKLVGIEVVPEFDMPGHLLSAISCYPYLSCEGKNVDVRTKVGVEDVIACAGNEKFYEFAKDIIDELCELFPCAYVHIGGDEVPKKKWQNCPKCQEKMKKLGLKSENQLQGYLTAEIIKYLKSKNKIGIVWDEKLDVDYPTDTVLQWWRMELNKSQSLEWMSKNEKVIISYGPMFYFDYSYTTIPLKKTYNFRTDMLGIKDKKNILGLEATVWTEWIRDEKKFDFNLYPRLQAFAETAWTEENSKNYSEFTQRLNGHLGYLSKRKIVFCKSNLWDIKGFKKLRLQMKDIKSNKNGYYEIEDQEGK